MVNVSCPSDARLFFFAYLRQTVLRLGNEETTCSRANGGRKKMKCVIQVMNGWFLAGDIMVSATISRYSDRGRAKEPLRSLPLFVLLLFHSSLERRRSQASDSETGAGAFLFSFESTRT